jgi:Flp pilus assembly protein TadD
VLEGRRSCTLLHVAVLAGLAAAACRALAAPAASPPPAAPAYVGAKACAPCHQAAYAGWSGSHHQRAMQPPTAQTVLGDFGGTTFRDAGISVRFFKKGDRFVVHTAGPDGTPADFPVAYTFGVDPLQQYLIPLRGGRLQSLTVAWDTRSKAEGGQRWFNLYPNEQMPPDDPLRWTGADQNWNYMCANCHSTNLQKHYDASTDTYASTWSDVDVACEACHGPGAQHVAWAARVARGQRRDGDNDGLLVHFPKTQLGHWTIDPATGNARPSPGPAAGTEIDTCAPCHMRRSVIATDYVPGQPLLDTYVPALLVEDLYFADGQIQGEVYEYGSFVQSKMYRAGVTCRNCHEPHGLALRAPGNGVCAECHLPSKYDTRAHHFHRSGSKGAACVGCHMPVTTYMIVDPRHDHSLRVPRPDLSVSLGTPNACNKCHADRDAVWARDQVRKWYGHDAHGYQAFAPALHAGRTGSAEAEPALRTLIRDDAQPPIARATALALLPPYLSPQSIATLQTGLADRDPLVRRAALGALEVLPPAQRLPLAAPLLADPVRAVRIEAARQLATVPAQVAGAEVRARIERGLEEFVAAQRVDADRPESHTNLCTLYGELGQLTAAESECRTAMRLQPRYTPAYVNLADFYRTQGRDPDGEKLLREGLARAPDDATLHHTLGLSLVRQKRLHEALVELERAVQLRPSDARFSYVLGIGQNSAGNTSRALEVLRAAHALHPTDRDLLLALATVSRDSGDTDAARTYARQLVTLAPNDPSARQLLQQLEAPRP